MAINPSLKLCKCGLWETAHMLHVCGTAGGSMMGKCTIWDYDRKCPNKLCPKKVELKGISVYENDDSSHVVG